MLFKLIESLVVATVAFQLVPGSWTPVAYDPEALAPEIIRGEIVWSESLPKAGDIAVAALPKADEIPEPMKINKESLGIKTTASNVIVADLATGKILFEKNADEPRSIASITKLMTALVFLDNNPGWDEMITVKNALTIGNNNFYAGERVKAKDLFNSALVGSDNTAARNLAYATGMNMDEFIIKMNEKAQAMELDEASFVDPVGLDPKNQASALDVIKILRSTVEYEEVLAATTKKAHEFRSVSGDYHYIKTTNDLLSSFINKKPYAVIAGKTGSLLAAGYCLAMVVENDGHAVLIVSLNSESDGARFQDVKSLAYWVFENYEWPE
ncbi:hypothetical protein GWN26_03335 [Candidatus Saccharibacteria bacterium]|nr:D-alanyl-D-alanine carboxypeptidase [Candidatus Saccharibacteria bacterium]NIV03395.1 hypothetical protein [Calditrichia bacterium]NIS37939.1 D-alanyl-D-alanine carboxypeptidase [Candidatus Saccharibacteria bacterium]NIV71601.1 hypothetical protein [Calditrichia bacterium]NIV98219.1 hypothetical protein [Candidatus Saccharibacteria bacterium]